MSKRKKSITMTDNDIFKSRRAAYHTLGCKLNFSETSEMSRRMADAGFERVSFDDIADVYVINTCSVTEEANRKCRSMIKRCIKRNKDAIVIVTGCYAQLEPEEVAAIKGVSLVLGSNQKNEIVQHIDNLTQKSEKAIVCTSEIMKDKAFMPSFSSGDRTRSFLKIQDGCDYFCSYCTIPFARGTSRSADIASTIEQAKCAAIHGAKEIILTGVNIGDFGHRNGQTFLQLIEQLELVEGVERYRISSIEPNLLTDEIIKHVAQSDKFMPHFHVPLQSGSDAVLKLMRRRYDSAFFAEKIATIKSLMPHAFIGIDVIVGVNGEKDEYFEESRRFISELDFSQLHVFTYSERPGTQALNIKPVIPIEERHRRNAILHEISEEHRIAFYKKHIGQDAKILVESSEKDGVMYGFTDNYLKVEIPFDASLSNTIQKVHLEMLTLDKQALVGKILK